MRVSTVLGFGLVNFLPKNIIKSALLTGSDGILVTANGTENFKGCRDSEFDQYGDVAAFGLYPEVSGDLTSLRYLTVLTLCSGNVKVSCVIIDRLSGCFGD